MSAAPLAGLRVLVTRPPGRADELIAAIESAGGSAVHIPLLLVTPLNADRDAEIFAQTRQRILDLDRYRRVIAISVNAAQYGLEWIDNYWPQLPSGIAWYGIGAATVAALAQRDIVAQSDSTPDKNTPDKNMKAAMNSEALLALPALQHIDGERILILRGVGGRETLASVLRERGAQVDYAECYRRTEPNLSAAQQAQLQALDIDAICANSQETLQNLWQCLTPAARPRAQHCALIVPSARVAAAAHALGFARVVAAANAGTPATLDALRGIAAIN